MVHRRWKHYSRDYQCVTGLRRPERTPPSMAEQRRCGLGHELLATDVFHGRASLISECRYTADHSSCCEASDTSFRCPLIFIIMILSHRDYVWYPARRHSAICGCCCCACTGHVNNDFYQRIVAQRTAKISHVPNFLIPFKITI